MKARRYFTVITSDSGIVDKLAFQLRILYNLGISCEYEYVHSTISFDRSWHSHYLKKAIDTFEKILFFRLGFRVPTYLEKILKRAESLLYKLDGKLDPFYNLRKYTTLNRFLGLDKFELYIEDSRFSSHEIVEIPLEQILAEINITQLSQLKEEIERLLGKKNHIICCFSAARTYSFLFRVQDILTNSGVDVNDYQFLNLSERYWIKKDHSYLSLPFQSGKIKVVIHIRRGDSTTIDLGSRKIYLHGEVMTPEDFEQLLRVDVGREIEIREYETVLQKIFGQFGEDKFSCILISDGYELTFTRIVRAMSRGELNLNDAELRILRKMGVSAKDRFANFLQHSNISAVIGESNANLLTSIHALASADIVIYGSIGFAYGVHKLFRKNKSSIMINVKNHDDSCLMSINEKIKCVNF